jgi:hypothetical protein
MIFDCEVLWGPWKGWPTKAQLSNIEINTYYIDWVRVWEPKKKSAVDPLIKRLN